MKNSLSIRSYTKRFSSHTHNYHQMVLTLNGHIEIEVEEYQGKVSVGEAILINANETHGFRASEEARFFVADMCSLPINLTHVSKRKFSISNSLLAYIQFIEIQLQTSINDSIEGQLFDLFFGLVENEPLLGRRDRRIEQALALIHEDISVNYSNTELANVACLGQTQFKKLFKDCTSMSVNNYLIRAKMEKARSLLMYTDYPVTRVASEVGYKDSSAFSRRFTQYFHQLPSQFTKKH